VPTDLRRYAHLEGAPTVIADRGEFEYQGWDVRTFARLLADSNEGAIDLLRSPIRYRLAYDPADLTAYIERTYNPIDLYHTWRGIATSNYRKYVSHHLVRNDDETFPIIDTAGGEYTVETDDGTMTVSADDERFTETQTKPTVKRNLTICRAAMSAYYLEETGERGEHDLPALKFETFLREQAPAVFDADRIDCARELLERKRAGEGDAVIGDAVGREFPPAESDRSRGSRTRRPRHRTAERVHRRDHRGRPVARATYQPRFRLSASGHKVKIRRERRPGSAEKFVPEQRWLGLSVAR